MSDRPKTPVAGEQAILASRYVDALYSLAEEQDMVDVVMTDLRGLRRLWDESPEWRFVACDPRLDMSAVTEAVANVIRVCDFEELTGHFLSVVAQNRRLSLLPVLIDAFLDEAARRRGEFRAEVRSARVLSPSQRDALAAALNTLTGGKTHLTVTEDASLIGGLTVRFGSRFIDASVKTRLDLLERSLRADAAA
jgi:F-type H+-transporting ATPase subunit delta